MAPQTLNKAGAVDSPIARLFAFDDQRRLTTDQRRYRDMKLHSLLFGWSDPDQALRVAAGILGKRASGGRTQALGSAARGAKPSRQCIEPGSLNPG
jgi:hypothetical protein